MSDELARRHGLEAFTGKAGSTSGAGVEIALLENRGFLNLRLDPRKERAVRVAEGVLAQNLPLAANTFASGRRRIYWLGPDEWLVETGAEEASALCGELEAALAGHHAAINDVSGSQVALHMKGPEARTILSKGCTLDLHPREFAPGQCARTGLARATALLACIDGAPTYALIVGRSFADYLCHWLLG